MTISIEVIMAGVFGIVTSAFAALLARGVRGIDGKIAKMETALVALGESIGSIRETGAEHRVRVASLENAVAVLSMRVDDLGGFLASQGYRKRDGHAAK